MLQEKNPIYEGDVKNKIKIITEKNNIFIIFMKRIILSKHRSTIFMF